MTPDESIRYTCDESRSTGQALRAPMLQLTVPAWMVLQMHERAGDARARGIPISNDIPDCAVWDGQAFGWVKATIDIDAPFLRPVTLTGGVVRALDEGQPWALIDTCEMINVRLLPPGVAPWMDLSSPVFIALTKADIDTLRRGELLPMRNHGITLQGPKLTP